MAVKYTLAERPNPADRNAPKKWYATAKADGELTFKDLSKEISQGSTTVSDTDVMAVLNDLIKVLGRNLANGKIVRLGDFGSFQIAISSEGAETETAFHSSMIKNPKIQFRPGKDLKDVTKTLSFEKYKR